MNLLTKLIANILIILSTLLCTTINPPTWGNTLPNHKPYIVVLTEDGKPLGNKVIHEYDELTVKGFNFNPNSNTDGLPLPVPLGVPHGVFITFGFFTKNWKPSQNASSKNRATNRSATKWAISAKALNQIPTFPFNFRNTIKNQAIELKPDGSFVTKIILKKPTSIPKNSIPGIYTYAAAEAKNPVQELAIPINFSFNKGQNTPNFSKDLALNLLPKFSEITKSKIVGGSISADKGASLLPNQETAFQYESFDKDKKIIKYQGTVKYAARYHLYDIVIKNPWLELKNDKYLITAAVSKRFDSSNNDLERISLATIDKREFAKPDFKTNNYSIWKNIRITWLPNYNFPLLENQLDSLSGDNTETIYIKIPDYKNS